jgi:hypothetical protein
VHLLGFAASSHPKIITRVASDRPPPSGHPEFGARQTKRAWFSRLAGREATERLKGRLAEGLEIPQMEAAVRTAAGG